VVVFAVVGGVEFAAGSRSFVRINAARKPAKVRLAGKVTIVLLQFGSQRDGISEGKDLPIIRVKPGDVICAGAIDDATKTAVVSVNVALPISIPTPGQDLLPLMCGVRGCGAVPVALEG